MTYDYKAAFDILANHQKWRRGCNETPATDPKALGIAIDAGMHALRIADKLMQEPSEGMWKAAGGLVCSLLAGTTMKNFITVRDQMLREINVHERGE